MLHNTDLSQDPSRPTWERISKFYCVSTRDINLRLLLGFSEIELPGGTLIVHRIVSEKSLSLFKIQAANFNGMGKHRKRFIYKGDCHWFKRKISDGHGIKENIVSCVSRPESRETQSLVD